MKWAGSVKDLGNYIAYDVSDIRHKRADFIWMANGNLVKYQDAVPQVKMYLLNSYIVVIGMDHTHGVSQIKVLKPSLQLGIRQ